MINAIRTDATIPNSALRFKKQEFSKYGAHHYHAIVEPDDVDDCGLVFQWCVEQFGRPFTATFEGADGDSTNIQRYDDLRIRRWIFEFRYPQFFGVNSYGGSVDIIFYDSSDATIFQMVML